MSILTEVSVRDAFVVFFATLGPVRATGLFTTTMAKMEPQVRRRAAWQGAAGATAIVLVVAMVGAATLDGLRISVGAVVVAGGFVLLLDALRELGGKPPPLLSVQPAEGDAPPWQWEMALFPVTIPVLVTAPGVMAIFGFVAIAGDDWRQRAIVMGTLLAVMVLNLLALSLAARAAHPAPHPAFRVFGWVIAALQAIEATQYIINGLMRSSLFQAPGP